MDDAARGERPRVAQSEYGRGFWEAVERDQLAIQECTACRRLRHYPQATCSDCGGAEHGWRRVSGRGEIYSFTIAHRAFHPAWESHVPYVIATIELEEGPRMVCDLLDVAPDSVGIGQKVEAYFETLPGQGRMPRFRIVR